MLRKITLILLLLLTAGPLMNLAMAAPEKDGGPIQDGQPPFLASILTSNVLALNARFQMEYRPLWNPSNTLVFTVLQKLPDYIAHSPEFAAEFTNYMKELPILKKALSNELCQVIGVTDLGQKAILLNFVPESGLLSGAWQQRYMRIYGGGEAFWRIIYLPASDTFTNLHVDHGSPSVNEEAKPPPHDPPRNP